MIKWLSLLSITLVLTNCKKDDSYLYYSDPPAPETHRGTYPIKNIMNDTKVDILWVVDNSGSMGSIQNNIIANSKTFMNAFLKNRFLDWKIGLISTDQRDLPYLGFQAPFDARHIDPVPVFQKAIGSLGINGDPEEFVFYNIERVIEQNNHFLREDSHLAVIMVTDENEQSEGEFGVDYNAQNFLSRIKMRIGSDHQLRFYGAFEMDDLRECGRERVVYKGSPFAEVITATKGFHISACVNDFGTQLATIGDDIVKLVKSPRILLKSKPKIETIRVLYRGQELPGGKLEDGGFWYYDDYFNSVSFYNLNFAPDFDNDFIDIDFEIDDGITR